MIKQRKWIKYKKKKRAENNIVLYFENLNKIFIQMKSNSF